jgi:hypothetical protein
MIFLRICSTLKTCLSVALLFTASSAFAQFKVGSKEVQVHGFLQQGFAVSNNNNFLSMKTSNGSFSMTDGGVNVSMRLTPKLRIGAQAFSRNIGDLGNGKVQLDWAFADYRFNDSFGIRAGKVKTTLGLFTDTQDMEFIHTWALLPQSLYPTDLRATTIAHVGGDIYGDISLRKFGRLSYVAYAGQRPDDTRGGYYLGTRDLGFHIQQYRSTVAGGDLRWATPFEGFTVGTSYFGFNGFADGRIRSLSGVPVRVPGGIPFRVDVNRGHTNAYYGDFQRGKFRAYSELWLTNQPNRLSGIPSAPSEYQQRGWYAAGSYRVHSRLELGSYFSSFVHDRRIGFSATNGIRDTVVTARFDITKYWNVKAETHFMDGFANPQSARTFYLSTNPQGLKPRTNLFLLRTGFAF